MVIGESCARSRLRAAESSVCMLRSFAVKASNGGHAKRSKNKDTWCRMLSHLRCGIRYSPETVNKLQGVMAQKAFCIYLRNPDGNRYVLYLYFNGVEWNWNYNWLDNHWNSDNPSVALEIFFISPFSGSFLLSTFHASHPNFYLFHLAFQIRQYIFCCLKILFPRASLEILLRHQVFLWQTARTEVFLFA